MDWGNNGIGNRFGKGKLNYIVLYSNKKYKIYDPDTETLPGNEIDTFFKYNVLPGNGIVGIKVTGLRASKEDRHIPASVRRHFKHHPCVVCGTSSDVVVDHKDGFYQHPAESFDDFQPLCTHCNLVKRQRYKSVDEKKQMEYLGSTTVPHLRVFDGLVSEDSLDKCFWYDPCAYTRRIADEIVKMKSKIEILERKEQLFEQWISKMEMDWSICEQRSKMDPSI